jgi:hypothetical protein
MSQPKVVLKDWLLLSSVAFGLGFGISLPFNRDLKQALIAGFSTVPATVAAVVIVQNRQKRQISNSLATLQAEIDRSILQKQSLTDAIATDTSILRQLQSELEQLEANINTQQALCQAETDKLTNLASEQQERENTVAAIIAELQRLEGQSSGEQERLQAVLVEKQHQESELAKLRTKILIQQQRNTELDASVTQKQARQQRLAKTVERLQTAKQQLSAQIDAQISQRKDLQREITQFLVQRKLNQNLAPDLQKKDSLGSFSELSGNAEDIDLIEIETDELTLAHLKALSSKITKFIQLSSSKVPELSSVSVNFAKPSHTEMLWKERLLPYWKHRDFPIGSRFLGSFRIQKPATDELLSLVGKNLRKIGGLTQARLSDHFVDPEENWVKIVTLALSEYAYYYSGDRFWEGFCDRLELSHSQNAQKALQTVADRGADLLGLVRAKGGYRYVSTLWLQSGIPHQNLDQFAQLVQELQKTYGWEHLAEAEHSTLAEILFDTCQTQHRGWGTLGHFLKSSCASFENSDTEKVDPISGQLVQGVAVVAQELERQQLSPQILLNEDEREAFLGNSYLPKNFFLRSWETLTRVITLRDSTSTRHRLVSLRPKRLFLEMNLESLNTQLVLPEQTLWQPKWKDLRGTNCTIKEANWEETMPHEGHLEIPELVISVESDTKPWECTLRNHNDIELQKWQLANVLTDLPCLIFDSITGEYIPLRQTEPLLIGASEIFCFTPKDIMVQLDQGIEQRDQGIPSSLRGWRGVHLELISPESTIKLKQNSSADPKVIQWKARHADPIFQGLRLQGKQHIYIEAPMLWLPPMAQPITLNLLIEDVNRKSLIEKRVEEILANQWRSLPLNQFLQASGRYEIKLWNISYRWSYRFEIREKFSFADPAQKTVKIRHNNQDCTHLPIQVETAPKFWATEMQMHGLWPLEFITLLLSNGEEETGFTIQADRAGVLDISVAKFYELLPKTECYVLKYQTLGHKTQSLIELAVAHSELAVVWSEKHVEISGLVANKTYIVNCWNFLMPNQVAIEIEFTAESKSIIKLDLSDGIYHVQIFQNNQRVKGLGWWCNYRDRYKPIPEEVSENSDLENYWYIILGNELESEFIQSISTLKVKLSESKLNSMIADIQLSSFFPEWLTKDSISAKLECWLMELQKETEIKIKEASKEPLEIKPAPHKVKDQIQGNWYLATVADSKKSSKRDIFCQRLEQDLAQKKLDETGILEFKLCPAKDYTSFVLVQVQNFTKARITLRNIEYFIDIARKPLTDAEVNRMIQGA